MTYTIHFHFPIRKLLNIISYIGFYSMIASNKQRQEHNNLAIIQREKLKGINERPKNLQFVKT